MPGAAVGISCVALSGSMSASCPQSPVNRDIVSPVLRGCYRAAKGRHPVIYRALRDAMASTLVGASTCCGLSGYLMIRMAVDSRAIPR